MSFDNPKASKREPTGTATSSSPWVSKGKPYSAVSNGVLRSDGRSSTSSSDDNVTSPPAKIDPPPCHFPNGAHHPPTTLPGEYQGVFAHHKETAPANGSLSLPQQATSQWSLPLSYAAMGGRSANLPPGQGGKEEDTRPLPFSPLESAILQSSAPQPQVGENSHSANNQHPPMVSTSSNQAASMVLPTLLLPNQQPQTSMDGSSRFSESTMYMAALMGRTLHPELLTQNQLSAITDAPECEWPILTTGDLKGGIAAYTRSGSFIDGPPAPPTTAAMGENVSSQAMGFQMPMLFPPNHTYVLMHEMNPPLHLLQCRTVGE